MPVGSLFFLVASFRKPADSVTDVKPDNILVNWTDDGQGNKSVTDVVLGDFDIAYQLKDNESIRMPHAQGNAMWRSPEAQTGSGVSKASDVYSFGLVVSRPIPNLQAHANCYEQCIFTPGGGDFLVIKSSKALAEKGISAEQEILTRHFCYFGPATKRLLEWVHIKEWREALEELPRHAEKAVEEEPNLKFEAWGAEIGPDALDMISGMMSMDPTARLTMNQVLAHRCWVETT
jgi:serine/threonine protein kinase